MATPQYDQTGHWYSRVSGQGPTRFQVCSFLAGITFAAFASFLAGKPLDLNGWWPTSGLLVIDALLGGATVALLLATLGTYAALLDLGSVTQQQVEARDQGAATTVERCYTTYHRSGTLMVAAVVCIILSLLIVGFYVTVPVGVITLAAVPISLCYLHLYKDHMVYGLPSWVPGSKRAVGTGGFSASVVVPLTAPVGTPLSSVSVATFTGDALNPAVHYYSANIDWGDGSTSSGSISATGANSFALRGSHTYSVTTPTAIAVTITAADGRTIKATTGVSVSG